MRKSAFNISVVIVAAGFLGGCSTMTATQKVSAVATPMSAPMMAQTTSAPLVQPQGLDFSTAVAMIASTPGSGVTQAGGRTPTQALALVAPALDQAVNRPAATTPRRASQPAAAVKAPVAPTPAPAPVTAAVTCDPAATVATAACPIVPKVRRF